MIRAVFVDVSGVLIQNNLPQIYTRYKKEQGVDRETFRSVFRFLHSGVRSRKEELDYLAKIGLSPETWRSFTIDFYHSEARNETLYQLLKSAKAKDVKIILTSNNVSGLDAILSKFGLTDLPDLTITSADIGLIKPDPGFWKYALAQTKKIFPDIKPEEVIVIDDHQENLDTAAHLGLNTLLYPRSDDLSQAHDHLRHQLAL